MGLFLWKKMRLRQRTHKPRASRNMGPFFLEKNSLEQRTHKLGANSLEQRTHKLGASKNMGAVNTCKATGFSLMVQKWNMHFSNALNCEANAQGLFNALWVPIFSRQKCTHLFAAKIYQSFRGRNVPMTKDPELRGP